MAEMFAKFCVLEYKRAHPQADLHAPTQSEPIFQGPMVDLDAAAAAYKPKSATEKLEERLRATSPAAVQPPNSKSLRYAIGCQVRSWLSKPSAPNSEDPWTWWRKNADAEWGIVDAARFLLVFGSGNAGLERIFSKAIRIFIDKCRKSADIKRAMMLNHSAGVLGMKGYPVRMIHAFSIGEQEDADDEDAAHVQLMQHLCLQ